MASSHPMAVRLGRRYRPDARDANFPLRTITQPTKARTRPWQLGPQLDQGQTPMCVGYSGRQWLTMTPVRYKEAQPDGPACYHGAQQYDGDPLPHDGSDSHGLMKFFQEQGLVGAYHWAQGIDDALTFLTTTGPLLMGANWHESMFTPDAQGFVHPNGQIAGGHEFVVDWYYESQKVVLFDNSWSASWNPVLKGKFKMTLDDFAALFADQGDLCAAVESSKV